MPMLNGICRIMFLSMLDVVEIAKSWYRVASHTPEQKILADERLEVCRKCNEMKYNEALEYFKCNACGCPLSAKVFSPRGPSACPKGKWVR